MSAEDQHKIVSIQRRQPKLTLGWLQEGYPSGSPPRVDYERGRFIPRRGGCLPCKLATLTGAFLSVHHRFERHAIIRIVDDRPPTGFTPAW